MATKKQVLLSVVGADRPGIVERITRVIVEHSGNVEQSRSARLGGEFAGFFLVSVEDGKQDALRGAVETSDGALAVSFRVVPERPRTAGSAVPCHLQVRGADHEGIIHEFCELLAGQGVNIAEMTTDVRNSPVSGTPMFHMDATVEVPAALPLKELRAMLARLADQEIVDVELRVES